MDGGTISIHYFHEISKVNIHTLHLEFLRVGGITDVIDTTKKKNDTQKSSGTRTRKGTKKKN